MTELHITTDDCEFLHDSEESPNQFCMNCVCWFDVNNGEVISIYDARNPYHRVDREEQELA